MTWPNAGRVHAQVIQRVALGYWPDVKFVGVPMCQRLAPYSRLFGVEVTVSIGAYCSGPNPATVALRDLFAKAFGGVLRLGPLVHRPKHTTKYTEHIGAQLIEAL